MEKTNALLRVLVRSHSQPQGEELFSTQSLRRLSVHHIITTARGSDSHSEYVKFCSDV